MEYPDPAHLPTEIREGIEARGSLNVYRMIAHSPNLAPVFFEFGDRILGENTVPPDLRELAIVRVGRRYAAEYEHHHHERLAQLFGVTDDELRAAATGEYSGLADDRAAVLRWTDALLDHHRLDDAQVAEVLETWTANQLADFVLTVGFYQLVCGFLSTFDVTIDGETPPF